MHGSLPPPSLAAMHSDDVVVDHSDLEAIDALASKYEAAGKRLHPQHLSPDCRKLLAKAGSLVEVSVLEDPDYGIAVDYGHKFDRSEQAS